jgi:hypothetical protein
MIRKLVLISVAALATFTLVAGAHDMSKMKMKTTTATLTGEIVDTGCYLGDGARGEKHIDCATKCIANGMPMALLTNKGKLYLLTLDHDNPDPYNKLKEMAGKTVAVTGTVMERSGMRGIDVTEFKSVDAVPAGK